VPLGRSRRRVSDPFLFDEELLAAHPADGRGPDSRLAGIDEAGRGCLAGPLVAAAVVFDYARTPAERIDGVTDSKLLKPADREAIYEGILRVARRISWAAYSPGTIDRVGLHRCNLEALCRVVESLEGEYRVALVDGFDLRRPDLRTCSLPGADYKSAAVGAASIVAKVVRDRLMRSLASLHPEYGFDRHMGYGTLAHRAVLGRIGPCALHRLSFRGVGSSQLGLWDDQSRRAEPS
jgi:ribonuclease HII